MKTDAASKRPHRIQTRLAAICAGLAVTGSLALAPAAFAQSAAAVPYSDVTGNAHLTAIEFLTAEGVLQGYPNGTFQPQNQITRAEFTAAVVRLLGPKAQQAATALSNLTPSFKDGAQIPTWAWGYVNYAQGQKLIQGYPDGTFRANQNITMVEAAAILLRAIGDTAAVPSGNFQSAYTIATYNLGLNQGVHFVAELPATRGEVAQMAYDAAITAPTLQSGYTSGSPTGTPLYMGGAGAAQTAWSGTVSGVSSNTITLTNAQGTQILNAGLASKYYLAGAADITNLQGAQVLVAENANGHVNFISVQSGAQQNNGTLAVSTTATPGGYNRVNAWTVQSTTNSAYGLLLSSGAVVPLVSLISNGGTQYYFNAPSAGVSADTRDLVGGVAQLVPGASISTVLNSAGQAVTVYATAPTHGLGVVTAVNTADNTLTYATGNTDGTANVAAIQPWTTLTLNGSATTLGSLQPNDVVAVSLVGNGNGGDTNATTIAATRQTVSGTIQQIQTSSGSPTQITLAESGGTSKTVSEDARFDANGVNLAPGTALILAMDAQGQARLALPAVAPQVVVQVESTGTTSTATSSGTVTQSTIVVNNLGQSTTYTLASGVSAPQPQAGVGYLAVLTMQPGTSTVTAVAQLQPFTAPSGDTLQVYSDQNGAIIVREMNASGQATGNAFAVMQSQGAVAYTGQTFVAFGSVPTNQTVQLWQDSAGTILGITY